MNTDKFFNVSDKNESNAQIILESTHIINAIKQIKLEEIKELKDDHKFYNSTIKPLKQNIIEYMKSSGENVIETETSIFEIKNDKLIIR